MMQEFPKPKSWTAEETAPVLRFAPSPNGRLHLGHAYSALLNLRFAREIGARLILRIDDTDLVRCTPVLEQRMLEDLEWLGFEWDGEPYRQSDHLKDYLEGIRALRRRGLVYPAFMSRKQVRETIELKTSQGYSWPADPDGAPHYPDMDRQLDTDTRQRYLDQGRPYSNRLDIQKAVDQVAGDLTWREDGEGPESQSGTIAAEPLSWGDVVLSGKDIPASYHLANVIDDAKMGITHVVRGRDLFWSTSVHRLLQELFGFLEPRYFHHDLILDDEGKKLSKSRNDTSLAELRASGTTPLDIQKLIGISI